MAGRVAQVVEYLCSKQAWGPEFKNPVPSKKKKSFRTSGHTCIPITQDAELEDNLSIGV
jgi:hypothetical protein